MSESLSLSSFIASTSRSGRPFRALALVVGRIVAFIRLLAHRRQVRELLELDERALKDIGLVRTDVLGALAEPMAKDPSIVLLVRSVERRSRVRAMAPLREQLKTPAAA